MNIQQAISAGLARIIKNTSTHYIVSFTQSSRLGNISMDMSKNYYQLNGSLNCEWYSIPKKIGTNFKQVQKVNLLNNPLQFTKANPSVNTEYIADYCYAYSFYLVNISNLKKLTKLKYIGRMAFAYCVQLCKNLTYKNDNLGLPDNLEEIGYGAFMACASIKTIFIPKSVKIIAQHAFSNSTQLKYIVFVGRTEDEIKAMPNYGKWSYKCAVKYIPGIINGEKNPIIDDLPEDSTNIGFEPIHSDTFYQTISSIEQQQNALTAPIFFDTYEKSKTSKMIFSSDNCGEYDSPCTEDDTPPCYTMELDDPNCASHTDAPHDPCESSDNPCANTSLDIPCDNPMLKNYPKPDSGIPENPYPDPPPVDQTPIIPLEFGDIPDDPSNPNKRSGKTVPLGGRIFAWGATVTDRESNKTIAYEGGIGFTF